MTGSTVTTEFKTGDLVLCKVGSFPPWPAIVFPQRLLRNDVYKKRKLNCVAVCFFNDPTYYWEQPHRLRPLNKTIINQFLKEGYKNVTQKDLIEAYKQASKYSNLKRFIKSRFTDENRINDLTVEESNNGSIIAGEDPFLGKKGDGRNLKVTAVAQRSKRRKSTHAYDKDDDDESDDTDSAEPIIDGDTTSINKKKHDHYNIEKSNKVHTKLDRSRRIEICLLFRRRIQKNLIQRDTPPTQDEIKESHKLLNKMHDNLDNDPPFFDVESLKHSKIYKLLKVIVNNDDLEEFHPICKDILNKWSSLIQQIKLEKNANEKSDQRKPGVDKQVGISTNTRS
ncbi:Pdp3p NDAI_0D00150 [Naumovozyma dairenensis CBS 421]|uniref:PWWP domain-containing protein n=1 Tax=Naumovozyma dairenensis (strain ATCC 10597 / BCRC 20456 / CBS 421 / NBRC 0211 / NRRL Y-12639) TaxID=1071378 RepID=G0W968_NAUDC|nr:hypothetical protein NDAI_0D00150 [Naumovozyma dairenensis CBS 421]CCD24329.1 hypothetical protein NDAI_0D00150 [Naumovozyma dairenensis CBS 421]